MQQQQLSGHQKVSYRQEHSLENNTPPPPEATDTHKAADHAFAKSNPTTPKNQDNTLQQNYPTLPEAIFEIPDSPKEQRQGRKQQVLTDVHKQSDQVKVTEPNHEEGFNPRERPSGIQRRPNKNSEKN